MNEYSEALGQFEPIPKWSEERFPHNILVRPGQAWRAGEYVDVEAGVNVEVGAKGGLERICSQLMVRAASALGPMVRCQIRASTAVESEGEKPYRIGWYSDDTMQDTSISVSASRMALPDTWHYMDDDSVILGAFITGEQT